MAGVSFITLCSCCVLILVVWFDHLNVQLSLGTPGPMAAYSEPLARRKERCVSPVCLEKVTKIKIKNSVPVWHSINLTKNFCCFVPWR